MGFGLERHDKKQVPIKKNQSDIPPHLRVYVHEDRNDCKCMECQHDRWGDEQTEKYGENNIETSRGL